MAKGFDVETLRKAAEDGRIHWHQHALARILERGIPLRDIVATVMKGDVIEVYPTDQPYPSGLLFSNGAVPLHVVAAVDAEARICHVITAYRPDLEHFEPDFKTRRRDR